MKRVAVILVLSILLLPLATASSTRAEGNLTLDSIKASLAHPETGEYVTFVVYVSSTGEYWDVKVGIYIDYELRMVKAIPYIDGNGSLWFTWEFNTSGRHDVTVVVDYRNSIPETNEHDNVKSIIVNVKSKPLPDLQVRKISIHPGVIFENRDFTVSMEFYSKNATSYNVPVEIYVDHQNHTLRWIPVIPDNQSYFMTLNFKLPAGMHIVEVVVNYGHRVKESDYDNDYGSVSFRVYKKSSKCNVVVGRLHVSNSHPKYGDVITIYANVTNGGEIPLLDLRVAVFYDGVRIHVGYIPQIPVNGTFNYQYSLIAYTNGTTMNHTISIFADYGNKYNETNESDNYAEVTITVENGSQGGPRVSPGDISLSMDKMRAGMVVTVYARIWNTRNNSAFVSGTMGVDNSTIKSFNVYVLAHGYTTVYMLWHCHAGWHQVWVNISGMRVFRSVWVDTTHAVVKFLNDSLKLSNSMPRVGLMYWLSVKIANVGDGYAHNVTVVFFSSQNNTSAIISVKHVNIIPGAYLVVTAAWVPRAPGNATVEVSFLGNEDINFLNLNESLNVTVIEPLPDLIVRNVTYSLHNYTATLNITLSNVGNISANNFVVVAEVDGTVKNRRFVFSVPPYSNVTVCMNVTLHDGDNVVTVVADYDNVVKEKNETNNFRNIVITVVPNNSAIYMALATMGVFVAILGVLSFFVYAIRKFIAAFFFGLVLSLLGLWVSLRERPPFSRMIESFHRWMGEQ